MKILSKTMNFIQMKVKTVKITVRLQDENIARRDIFAEISYLSHCFAEIIVTNTRSILQN